jgi:hypothetical protein
MKSGWSPAFRRNFRLTRRLKAELQPRALGVAWFVNENGMHAKAMQAQLFTAPPGPSTTGVEGTLLGTHRQIFTQTRSASSCKSAIKATGHHPRCKTNISSAKLKALSKRISRQAAETRNDHSKKSLVLNADAADFVAKE